MNYREKYPYLYDVLFLLVFLLAGYLRLTGLDWGQGGGQHPDENHFSGVLENLRTQTCENPMIPVEACPPNLKHWISIISTQPPRRSIHTIAVFRFMCMATCR